MRHALVLLLTAIAASAQQISWSATLTPENGGTQTRITWELATYEFGVMTGGGSTTFNGPNFNGGNTSTGAAFNTLPVTTSFAITTDIVYTNLTKSQSMTADTLQLTLMNGGPGVSYAGIGLISSQGMTVADNDWFRVTGSATGSFVFNVAFSHFNAGTWSGGPMSLTVSGAPVPEPSTYGLALGGLALAGAVIRRRRKA